VAQDVVREQLEKSLTELERIGQEPSILATVVAMDNRKAHVVSGKGEAVIELPDRKMRVGDAILLQAETLQYVMHSPFNLDRIPADVLEIIEEHAVIERGGVNYRLPSRVPVKAGDRVLLDAFGTVVLRVLPPTIAAYTTAATDVTWDDVKGNEDAKAALIEAIELPYKHPELYAKYGARPTKGVLLTGPPGCGKTMLGKAAATSINAADGFISVKGPEVLNEYVGVAEARIRSLFARARRYKETTGRSGTIFVDEADALLSERSSRHAMMEKTIVPMFLTELDGIAESGALVILSTNRSHSLDTAVVRDGRIDRKVLVARPTLKEAVEIVVSNLVTCPINGELEEISGLAVETAWQTRFANQGRERNLGDFASGSLFAGVANKAKSNALRRDIAAGSGATSGVSLEDLLSAVQLTARELSVVSLEEHT
jgi:proteasome-associated ATPase